LRKYLKENECGSCIYANEKVRMGEAAQRMWEVAGLIRRVRERRGKHFVRAAKQLMSGTWSTSNGEGGLSVALVFSVCNVAGVVSSTTLDVIAHAGASSSSTPLAVPSNVVDETTPATLQTGNTSATNNPPSPLDVEHVPDISCFAALTRCFPRLSRTRRISPATPHTR